MGMLDKFRHAASAGSTGNEWVPPAFGRCECEGHIEDVLELRSPLAADAGATVGQVETGDVAVWALLTSGGLATVPLAEERRHLTNGVSIVRQGPFHWKVLAGDKFRPFLAGGDVVRLEQAMAAQPAVDDAMWIRREGALVVGAPTLCANGVQCAVVQALRSAYVRQSVVEAPTAETA
jgi:hypothetical protein